MPGDDRETLFRKWLDEHLGIVIKLARAYTFTADDAQDLIQEILLQLWRSLSQFEARSSPSTWIYRVGLNTALDWHRHESRRRSGRQPLVEMEDLPAAGLDVARQVTQRETLERLYGAIRLLPKTDAALVLLYLDDLSYREIADVLGISENNVGVKLNRAKRALAELMSEVPHEP